MGLKELNHQILIQVHCLIVAMETGFRVKGKGWVFFFFFFVRARCGKDINQDSEE